ESDARPMGRATRGVKGINLGENDELVGMVVADPDGYLLTLCEKGYGKRTPFGPNTEVSGVRGQGSAEEEEIEEVEIAEPESEGEESSLTPDPSPLTPSSAMRYRKQRRGGKGLRDIKTEERNGP